MRKYLLLLLSVAILSCSCAKQKSIPRCEGGNLNYSKLELLAEADNGSKLLRIDGRYYSTCEDGSVIDFGKGKVSYSEGNGENIVRVSRGSNVSEYIWNCEGEYQQTHIIVE